MINANVIMHTIYKEKYKRDLLGLIRELCKVQKSVNGGRYTGAAQDEGVHYTSAEMIPCRNFGGAESKGNTTK